MKHLPFRIFTLAIVIGLIVPQLIQDGMFMDGVLYAAVAKNQAEGIGSFWYPIFADTWNKHGVSTFHEHPPLVFGIQSLFFKIFGASIYVERFYSFLTAMITAWLIHLNWKTIFRQQPELINFSWLPILFWIIIPVCFWSFQNNMHENTMGIFTLLSSLFLLKFYFQKQKSTYLIIAGGFIFLATFAKGVPGFFPLAIPFLVWISLRKTPFVKIVHHTSLLGFSTFLLYAILMLYEPAKESLSFYFESRLLGRIDADPTVGNRFYIVGRLIQELLPPFILAGILLITPAINHRFFISTVKKIKRSFSFISLLLIVLFPLPLTMIYGFNLIYFLPLLVITTLLIVKPNQFDFIKKTTTYIISNFQAFYFHIKNNKIEDKYLKLSILFFLIGLAGTLPLLLTMVQKGFYMVHALPFFGIAMAILVAPKLYLFIENKQKNTFYNKTFTNISYTLLLASIIFSLIQIGSYKRDQEMLHDVYLLKNILPKDAHITVEKSIHQDWGLKVYLMRNNGFSTSNTHSYPYFLVEKKKKNFKKEGYEKGDYGLVKYDLFTKQ